MYQGRPKPASGGFFKREWFVKEETPRLEMVVRYWDLATSAKQTGDWTVGALCGMAPGQIFHIKHVERFRAEWPDAAARIIAVTEREAIEYAAQGVKYVVGVDARLSQQGFFQQLMKAPIFDVNGKGLTVPLWDDKSVKDKKERANGWAADGRMGRLRIQPDPTWNEAFINECLAFTGNPDVDVDDQVDGVSGAHELIWRQSGSIKKDKFAAPVGSQAWLDKTIKTVNRSQRR
jgi:phage terminase large subunit-like protein